MNYISVLLEAILKCLSVMFLLFITFVALIVLVAIVLVCCCNKKNIKWMFKHYKLTLVLIVFIIIVIAFFAHNCGGDWDYIIPVAIALASITFPLLNDAKRRNDSKQEAFDYFYFSIKPLPAVISYAISKIDYNFPPSPAKPIRLAIDSRLNANFINHINHADLNRFFREQGILNELREASSSLIDIDNVNDYYSKILSEHNITIREQEKIWNRWQKLLTSTKYEILGDTELDMQQGDANELPGSFKTKYEKWADDFYGDTVEPKEIYNQLGVLKNICDRHKSDEDAGTKGFAFKTYDSAQKLHEDFKGIVEIDKTQLECWIKLVVGVRKRIFALPKVSDDFYSEINTWITNIPISRQMVSEELAKLMKMSRGFMNTIGVEGKEREWAIEIYDETNFLYKAYDTMDYEKQRMLNRLSAQREILEVAKKRFKDFIENNKPLISKELKKQLDEMEKAQTSK